MTQLSTGAPVVTRLCNKVIWKVAKHIDCDWGRSEYTTIDCDQGTAASNLYNVIGVVRRPQTVSNQFLKLNLRLIVSVSL